jgi:L-rhamnose mutarotase
MQRVCFVLKVKKDMVEDYKRIHADVWPEMLDALRRCGWHNYSIFLRPDGLLIGYLETPDFKQAVAGMKNYPVNERWQNITCRYFEGLDGKADDAMAGLEEVFHLD